MRLPSLPSTLLLGAVFLALGTTLWVRPELATSPLGETDARSGARRYWGRIVAVVWLLLGVAFGTVGLWNLLYA